MKFKKAVGLATAATMMLAMSATAFAADGDVYAKFCRDGQSSVSMMQKVVDGPCTITQISDSYSEVTIAVTEFIHTQTVGSMTFTGQGMLTGLVIDGETYDVDSLGDVDGDNLEEGEITIVLPNEKIAVDSETVFTDVTAEYEITMGSAPADMSSEADLYFSSDLAAFE